LVEYSLMMNLLLFSSLSVVLVIYIRKVWKASAEYNKARNIVEEVILSFNKEIEVVKQKMEELNSKIENIEVPDISQIRSELDSLSSKIENLLKLYSALKEKIENIQINADKISEISSQQEKKGSLREQDEISFSVKPVFPIMRERALAPLTPTEIRVLEILSSEGEKTVREIRSRIGLTREHTGRLMKSLYDKGYVERRTDKIPYVYRIKKEMENMLQKNP